jgi:hypothetical protein
VRLEGSSAGTHDTTTLLDAVVTALGRASEYNRRDQTAPAAVLWTDRERLWEPLLPALRSRLLLLTLGPFDPPSRTGPAYWLRCALAGTVEAEWPEVALGADRVPVLYLPGVSRADLRAVEDCPRQLQPLAELQYRGVLWTQKNGRDWTPLAFLVSRDGGLGIEVAGDDGTRRALQLSLTTLAGERVDALRRHAPLGAGFFEDLTNPDPPRLILNWLDDPAATRASLDAGVWAAFRGQCQRAYRFDPESDGPIVAAQKLGAHTGPWEVVWQRFAEAPDRWPNVPERLRAAGPVQRALFDGQPSEAWPQDNEIGEALLCQALTALQDATQSAARAEVRRLEQEHGLRREWVWARLRQAPLARALAQLVALAAATERVPGGASVPAVATGWTDWGWQADAAALQALGLAERAEDNAAVAAAVVALYRPWLEETARAFQEAVRTQPETWQRATPIGAGPGNVLLFSDALRYDAAERLQTLLKARGLETTLDWRLTPLPGVTPTAKYAVAPVAERLTGGSGFDTAGPTGSRLTADGLRVLLADAGYQVLSASDVGDPSVSNSRGWTELGEIDGYGHEHGRRLARHLSDELLDLAERSAALLDAGWRQVTIVTDHGWLLLPGGLPKVDLPQHVTEPRKGRCARIRQLQPVDQQTVPWHWDDTVRVAVPPGIACYEAGKEYEHGGLSPQECVVPLLTVRRAAGPAAPVSISETRWVRLRCRVTVDGGDAGLLVDIRTQPANPATSLCGGPEPVIDGTAAVVVEDADLEGSAAYVVVLAPDGAVAAQQLTSVGGE